ncbi:MAG: glycoside hydrolase family 172 protein [Terriglobia bacterium]
MKKALLWGLLILPVGAQAQQNLTSTIGLDALTQLDQLPLLRRGIWFHSVSSQDVTGGNEDGFAGAFSNQYVENGRHVLLDARGPMCVQLFRSARLDIFKNKMSFDGNLVIETRQGGELHTDVLPFSELYSGKRSPFLVPLVEDERRGRGTSWSFVPLCSDDGVKISADQAGPFLFYDIFYHSYSQGTVVPSFVPQMNVSPAIERWKAIGKPLNAKPAESMTRSVEVPAKAIVPFWGSSTPGTITAIYLTLEKTSEYALRHVRIRAYWDGETQPAIDSPLGPFFGTGYWPVLNRETPEPRFGFVPPKGPKGYPEWLQKPVELGRIETRSLPVGTSDGKFYNFFPMPFFKSARLELVNESDQPLSNVTLMVNVLQEAPPPSSAYFHAQWREENPTLPHHDYTVLETQGHGHYVGAVLVMSSVHFDPGKKNEVQRIFLEGDARFYIDGNRTFANASTGTEEYFLWGWYDVTPPDKIFSNAVNGYPTHEIDTQEHTVMYRFHLSDLVPYYRSFRFALEHGPEGQVPSNYSGTAFYYQVDTPLLELTDQLDLMDPASVKSHRYSAEAVVWAGCRDLPFEGDRQMVFTQSVRADKKNGLTEQLSETLKACGQRVNGKSEFSVSVLSENQGIELRRLMDYAGPEIPGQEEVQRVRPLMAPGESARVFVDGESAGEWYTPARHARLAWLEDSFQIPARLTAGKKQVRIRLDVAPDSPWSAFQYRAYSYSISHLGATERGRQ